MEKYYYYEMCYYYYYFIIKLVLSRHLQVHQSSLCNLSVSLFQPSYVFQKRPLTPPRYIKQRMYFSDLADQVSLTYCSNSRVMSNIYTCNGWVVGLNPGKPGLIITYNTHYSCIGRNRQNHSATNTASPYAEIASHIIITGKMKLEGETFRAIN